MDGLLSPRVSTPPVPRPRKASSVFLSSTPKHILNARLLPHINGHDYQLSKSSRVHQQGMHRAPSLDSATHRDLPLSPITRIRDAQSDSETEEDCGPASYRGSASRLSNGSLHCKHFKKPHQHSHSLPATPRVNSNSHPPCLNGNFPLGAVSPCHGIPCLLAPNTSNTTNQDNISQSSQYITCQTGVSHLEGSVYLDQPETKLPGAIDYSSLPLPHENLEPVRRTTDISRHVSEPCITESQGECSSLPFTNKKRGTRNLYRTAIFGKENNLMDNIKESGQSEGESEEMHALEVQWRFIQTLVAELNTTKCNNRKLMAELHQAKMEIQIIKASLDSYTECGLQPGAITEMVSQIHAAQKVRDEAMMSRIKLANEERDAALTHTRVLLDKLSISPGSNVELGASVEASEQEIPSGGNSSCTSSPRRNDARLRKSSISSYSSATPFTSAPGASSQGSETRSAAEREANTLAQLAALEEELRTLRLATSIHHTVYDGDEIGQSSSQGISRVSAEYMEGLCTQLQESEVSRWQLHEQCTRLERLVNVLRKKVNGLSTLETTGLQEGTKLTLVDFTLLRPNSDGPPNSTQPHLPTSTSSEGEHKDSMSSLESIETASASSWRRGDVPYSSHSPTVLHSNSLLHHESSTSSAPNSHYGHHGNFVNSTLYQSHSNSEKSVPINPSPSSYSSSSSTAPHISPHHRQQGSSDVAECDPHNIPGITIVGPITEL
ncbi:uncharacterized protein [Palaemon carinicauda]|uniref:uncharacterized protein isoform X2 n=1 Tax=Palaemon carinicauda TaxID=392227 RepID=UPI0035B5BFE2